MMIHTTNKGGDMYIVHMYIYKYKFVQVETICYRLGYHAIILNLFSPFIIFHVPNFPLSLFASYFLFRNFPSISETRNSKLKTTKFRTSLVVLVSSYVPLIPLESHSHPSPIKTSPILHNAAVSLFPIEIPPTHSRGCNINKII
jgi:hypothetical protein